MGRGRAKAKQTKVARDLKYRSTDTDFASLEKELRGSEVEEIDVVEEAEEEVPDPYADYAQRYDVDDTPVHLDDEDERRG